MAVNKLYQVFLFIASLKKHTLLNTLGKNRDLRKYFVELLDSPNDIQLFHIGPTVWRL